MGNATYQNSKWPQLHIDQVLAALIRTYEDISILIILTMHVLKRRQ